MSLTPLSLDNIQCNSPASERSMPSKYVPQMPSTVPQRKQSVFVAPKGLLLSPGSRPFNGPVVSSHRPQVSPNRSMQSPNRTVISPPRKSSLAKPNAQILEQHISKIISENAAIVETLDPLWSKRYISRNVLPIHTTNGLSFVSNHMPEPTSGRRFSEVHHNQPLSKLQSALLGKSSTHMTSSPIRKYSDYSSSDSSKQSVIINAKDSNVCTNDNNNNNNDLNRNSVLNHLNNSNKCEELFKSESIVRNLLTTKTPAIQVSPTDKCPKKTSLSLGAHPQNPEGSIIKDLLLKSRDEGRKKSRTEVPSAQVIEPESSMLVYVCTVCNIAFRNKENLEVHQIHYCKGNDDLSVSRPSKHKMEDLVQRKVSVMARPGFGSALKHYQHPKQSSTQPFQQQSQQMLSTAPTPPVGNILKQQLLAPNQGSPLKKRKISEPVFRNNIHNLSDIQIMEEQPVRRVSVVQSTNSSTTKSNHALDTTSLCPPSAPLPSTSTSHTVIQSVLHSGATVIENYSSQTHSKYIPIEGIDDYSSRTTHMTTSTQPVLKSATDLVKSRVPIEILPAYLPHLKRPQTKITFKGPIVFPVLKKKCSNGSNYEFDIEESDSELKTNTTSTVNSITTCAFKQVASLPIECSNPHKMSEMEEQFDEEMNEEMEVLDKENDKQLPSVSSPTNDIVLPKTTGAIRPRTLSLRTNNGSNLISSTLVSPDTPRPNKACVQLYMNGQAYSRIGLKVTPRPVYCTIYKPQPMFVPQETDPNLSMYSNWTLSPLASEDVMNLAPTPVILGLYDSRVKQRVDSMVMTSAGKTDLNSTHSSYWRFRKSDEEKENLKKMIEKLREEVGENVEEVYRKISEEVSASSAYSGDTDSDGGGDVGPPKRVRIFEGGFKSNEDYTYVRGRGRGKYVCEECGIRCKKPSMLKKHIRTHTDLRPYSCRHCAFAFKTKGNLTKHMKSKAHHKKCVELGIIPVPITIDDSQIDTDALAKQEMLEISCGGLPEDEDEDEDEGEWDEDEEEEDDEGVPIPLIELQRYEMLGKTTSVVPVPGQFDDADLNDDGNRVGSESGSAATEAQEQEAARSLLILSGSGSESDLTNPLNRSRKTSDFVEEVVNSPEKRKVSVIDRRVSQHMIEEKQRRVSAQMMEAEQQRRLSAHVLEDKQRRVSAQVLENEDMNRVSQQMLDIEKSRRISQQMDPNLKPNEPEFHSPVTMKPPTEPPPPLMTSPRKLSPIEQLQQQVQQQHHLLQTTWTPNCDQLSRPRSYSFNDIPLMPSNPNVFTYTSHIPIEPIEPIRDESSDESQESFASRRYSMSVIADRRFESQPKPTDSMSSIPEREEPMDLSLNAKQNEEMSETCLPSVSQSNHVSNMIPTPLRQGEFIPTAPQRIIIDSIDGKSICSFCSKQFSKPSQLRLHINIHYFERPFRCDSCAVSFRTKGHLQKHKRSVIHLNKVNMNMTFGTPTTDNPRPFKCDDCKVAFRIHGHLAKHLRAKMHIMKLECLGKLPFGMYAEMERSGVNLNEIDTTDCENSLQSLQLMAQRLYDPRQMRWASEPVPESDEHFDEESVVKNEPNDNFYSIEQERHPLGTNSQTEPLVAKPLQSESPPNQHSMPPTVVVQQQSGFTSTRSNTCHLCGRLFKAAKFLQVHLYCDHSEDSSPQELNEKNDFECDICHKGFNDISLLQQHLLTHTAVRPFVCDRCDAGFTSSSLLTSHLQTHHSLAQPQIA